MSTPVENLVQRLHARRSGQGWITKCPAHEDRTPSLSIVKARTVARCSFAMPVVRPQIS